LSNLLNNYFLLLAFSKAHSLWNTTELSREVNNLGRRHLSWEYYTFENGENILNDEISLCLDCPWWKSWLSSTDVKGSSVHIVMAWWDFSHNWIVEYENEFWVWILNIFPNGYAPKLMSYLIQFEPVSTYFPVRYPLQLFGCYKNSNFCTNQFNLIQTGALIAKFLDQQS